MVLPDPGVTGPNWGAQLNAEIAGKQNALVNRLGSYSSGRWYAIGKGSGGVNAQTYPGAPLLWPIEIPVEMTIQALSFQTYLSGGGNAMFAFYTLSGLVLTRLGGFTSNATSGSTQYSPALAATLPAGTVWLAYNSNGSIGMQAMHQWTATGLFPTASTGSTGPYETAAGILGDAASGTLPANMNAIGGQAYNPPVLTLRAA